MQRRHPNVALALRPVKETAQRSNAAFIAPALPLDGTQTQRSSLSDQQTVGSLVVKGERRINRLVDVSF